MTDPVNAALLEEIKGLRRDLQTQAKDQGKALANISVTLGKRRKRSSTSEDVDLANFGMEMAIATGLALGVIAFHQASMFVQGQPNLIDRVVGTDFYNPVKKGDKIGGYEVTSGFGNREHPVMGGIRHHNGVDLGTPVGTTLYFPVTAGTVECKQDPSGYGLYAVITATNPAEPNFLAGHLSNCAGGSFKFGQVFAKTGDSGMSTAPHLHHEQHQGGKPVEPTKGWVIQLITGNKVEAATGMAQNEKITRLRRAIIGQESGGDFKAVNPDSGAMGYGQLMPSNVTAWSREILGHEVSHDEFLNSPDLQVRIIDGKLQQYWDTAIKASGGNESEAIRRVASGWYSGQQKLFDDASLQFYGGSEYPSIRDYTLSVLERYQGQ